MADDETARHDQDKPSDDGVVVEPPYRASRGRVAALVVLAVLPVVLTAACQPFLPDTVPLHYGASGTPDRWGPKAELFVTAGIVCVLSLFIAGIYAVIERQRETGREDWIVPNGQVSFPVAAAVLAIMALLQAIYVFAAFQLAGFTMPANAMQLGVDLLIGSMVAGLLALSLYMLITGKGLSLVNFHPGTSDLEKRTGADKQQARAIGGLLLFITLFVVVEWMMTR